MYCIDSVLNSFTIQKGNICQESEIERIADIRYAFAGATDLLNDHNPIEYTALIRKANVPTCSSEVRLLAFLCGKNQGK